jgi:hypothetical protein
MGKIHGRLVKSHGDFHTISWDILGLDEVKISDGHPWASMGIPKSTAFQLIWSSFSKISKMKPWPCHGRGRKSTEMICRFCRYL